MKTIIAAYCDQAAANNAIAFLHDQGIEDIRLLDSRTAGPLSQIRKLDIPDDRAQIYAELLRRGAIVVAANTDRDARMLAEELDRRGSLDLDVARDRWRKAGWDSFDPDAMPFDAEACARERSDLLRESGLETGETARSAAARTPEQRDLEVIEENVVIGKREVPLGGVRVRTFVVERPVRKDVELREERVDVTREPVSEPVPASPLGATLSEEEFEITARGEEVVVGKEARVVERVHVGKTEGTRTERVEETERRRDVEVEPIETGEAPPEPPRR